MGGHAPVRLTRLEENDTEGCADLELLDFP